MDKYSADRDALIERYRSYAHALASDFIGRVPAQVDKDDVVGYAELGLVEAATSFNPSAGVNFKTFAYYRIRGAIYDGLRQLGGMPREFYRQLKFERAATACLEDYATQPSSTTPSVQYSELRNLSGSLLSAYLLSLDSLPLEPAAALSQSPDRRFQQTETARQVREAVAGLPAKNRQVIEDYYFHERSLEEIARSLGLSKSWVCRLHAKGMELLRPVLDALQPAAEATISVAGR